jgi:hypothetical protein
MFGVGGEQRSVVAGDAEEGSVLCSTPCVVRKEKGNY